jgi:hypothetical protein
MTKNDLMHISIVLRWLIAALLLTLLTACSSTTATPEPPATDAVASPIPPSPISTEDTARAACPVTEPAWVKPPEDTAVQGSPGFGYYYVNEDSSIWAAAWWTGEEESHLRVSEEGIKTGWFRPAGAELKVTGKRIDGEAPPFHFHAPCCYPTRFQASGLYFPTEGCWELNAKAAESELSFIVWVEPEE